MFQMIYHEHDLWVEEWGKPVPLANGWLFFPTRAATDDDLREYAEAGFPIVPPMCGAPLYVGDVTNPYWN